jgi:protein disulfide-isomerase-like protein
MFALFLLSLAAAQIARLTVDDFEDVVFEPKHMGAIVMFDAPWCDACKEVKPVWEQLATRHSKKDVITVGEVDCTSEGGKPICDMYGVRTFPTFKWAKEGDDHLRDYNGPKNLDEIEYFIRNNFRKPKAQTGGLPGGRPGMGKATEL